MLKQRFLKNSSRLLLVATVILFLGNLVVTLFAFSNEFALRFTSLSKFPQLVSFLFPLLAYLSLNDEKSAHRKIKDVKSQRVVIYFKRFLVVIFASLFFKSAITTNLINLKSNFWNLVLSLILVVLSYSFFLTCVSLWYFIREKIDVKIRVVALVSTLVSLFYIFYKFLISIIIDYPVVNISLNEDVLTKLDFSQQMLCLLQYAVNIVMLITFKKYYEKKEDELETIEQALTTHNNPSVYDSIAEQKGYGMDFCDDLKNE